MQSKNINEHHKDYNYKGPNHKDSNHILPKELFKPYDIRGHSKKFTRENVIHFGYTLGQYFLSLGIKNIIIGYDMRSTSPEITTALIQGLKQNNLERESLNIHFIGKGTTAYTIFSQHQYNNSACVMITASHNPWDDNGMKLYIKTKGKASTSKAELARAKPLCGNKLKTLYSQQYQHLEQLKNIKYDLKNEKNTITENIENLKKQYIYFLLSNINKENISKESKVCWNANFGGTSIFLKDLISQLPGTHTIINVYSEKLKTDLNADFSISSEHKSDRSEHEPDPSEHKLDRSGHEPDPINARNIQSMQELYKKEHYDWILSFDGDGDRIMPMYKGIAVDPHIIILALAIERKKKYKRCKVVWDLHVSNKILRFAANHGIINIISKVGHSNIQAKIAKNNAHFGAEQSYHFFFKNFFDADDGLFAALQILQYQESVINLHSDPGLQIYKSQVYRLSHSNPKEALHTIKRYLKLNHIKHSLIDGVKIFYNSGFILIRASNTQACLSVMYESETLENKAILSKYLEELLSLVSLSIK